jgi:hypothetical protein
MVGRTNRGCKRRHDIRGASDVPEVAGNPPAHPALPGPWDVPPLEEGEPHTRPIAEDGVHSLIRQVHAHPHQVTVYAAGQVALDSKSVPPPGWRPVRYASASAK